MAHAKVYLAEREGRALGYISVSSTGDDLEIRKIAVEKESRRTGIAQQLFQSACPASVRILIDVAGDNESALAFYRALGFSEQHRRRKYYASGADAIVMERRPTS